MKASDRYLKIVEWSEEDDCYVGTCPGLMLGGVHGDDEAEVYRELCEVVDEWVRIYEEDGEPLPKPTAGKEYSGKFVVRVGKDLHKELAIAALREGESLNTYCVEKLREGGRRQEKPPRAIGARTRKKDRIIVKKAQHVVRRGDRWAVRGEGNKKDTSRHDTQQDAIARAREIAKRQGTEVVIHKRGGRVRDSKSYGNDPLPPRERKG